MLTNIENKSDFVVNLSRRGFWRAVFHEDWQQIFQQNRMEGGL